MVNPSVLRLEHILKIKPKDVCPYMDIKLGAVYYQRRKHPEKYKIILLGIRMYSSSLKPKEILSQIEPVEKIVEKAKGK